MTTWSQGYYEAVSHASAGKPRVTVNDLLDYSIANFLVNVIRDAMNENKRIQGSNTVGGRYSSRLNEILSQLKFDRLKGQSEEYWNGYYNGLLDANNIELDAISHSEVGRFNYQKKQLLNSIEGMIGANERSINAYKKKLLEAKNQTQMLAMIEGEIKKLENTESGLKLLNQYLENQQFLVPKRKEAGLIV